MTASRAKHIIVLSTSSVVTDLKKKKKGPRRARSNTELICACLLPLSPTSFLAGGKKWNLSVCQSVSQRFPRRSAGLHVGICATCSFPTKWHAVTTWNQTAGRAVQPLMSLSVNGVYGSEWIWLKLNKQIFCQMIFALNPLSECDANRLKCSPYYW